jgi:hypothetical protein
LKQDNRFLKCAPIESMTKIDAVVVEDVGFNVMRLFFDVKKFARWMLIKRLVLLKTYHMYQSVNFSSCIPQRKQQLVSLTKVPFY